MVAPQIVEERQSQTSRSPLLVIRLGSEPMVEAVRKTTPLPRSRSVTLRACSSSGASARRLVLMMLASTPENRTRTDPLVLG
jgi:hypothetical protein